jgi:RimJ/RimL family protein N-acetyltransferase
MITGNRIILRDKRVADAQDDYAWQTDPELARLDAAPVLILSFPHYLESYANELRLSNPAKRRFAIDTADGNHIGNCSYYGLNEAKGEAELGIMIGNRDYWNKGYGTDAVTTLVSHIFRQTNLRRIYLKTLETNIRARKCFQKCGFSPYSRMDRDGYSFTLMEIHRQDWTQQPGAEGQP